ncbi:hypothetical protein DPMN_012180 [Dreissena polymorpha]|uniref:Uncharacterized protein n=1 Tax=Dreissena polymorpha TaxID=45954 RepID=A0A9D4N1W8_DREPO|nr:hypothetical protein DPMN_012180 [Dreissena polymorpha]
MIADIRHLHRDPYIPRQSYGNNPVNAVRVPKTGTLPERHQHSSGLPLPGSDAAVLRYTGTLPAFTGAQPGHYRQKPGQCQDAAGFHRGTTGDNRGSAGLHQDKP